MPGTGGRTDARPALGLQHRQRALPRPLGRGPGTGRRPAPARGRGAQDALPAREGDREGGRGSRAGAPLTPDQERAGRIEVLRRIASASITGGGSYLSITASGNSAGAATFLANAVADAYVKHQEETRDQASRRAVAWLNQQVYELRDQAARKEQALAELDLDEQSLAGGDRRGLRRHARAPRSRRSRASCRTARINLLAAQERLAALSPRAAIPVGQRECGCRRLERARAVRAGAAASSRAARLRFTPTHPGGAPARRRREEPLRPARRNQRRVAAHARAGRGDGVSGVARRGGPATRAREGAREDARGPHDPDGGAVGGRQPVSPARQGARARQADPRGAADAAERDAAHLRDEGRRRRGARLRRAAGVPVRPEAHEVLDRRLSGSRSRPASDSRSCSS